MRVGFDARDVLRKRTGVVNYTLHLARALGRQGDGSVFLAYVDGFSDPAVVPPPDVQLRRRRAPGPLWKHLALPLALAADRADLFHSPTGTLPAWSPCPTVVTIHDLYADVAPEWFPARMAGHLQRAQRRAARSARMVIAVSENTRADLVRRFGIPAARVVVVPNGVDHAWFRPGVAGAAGEQVRTGEAYGVAAPFVLCVGSLLPWRNATRLLRAVARLRERERAAGQQQHQLLFVGRDIWGTDPTARLAREQGWEQWVRFAGYAPDEDLPRLYRAADVFAYPSLYEGFGIPPVEAMACGTPVVASTGGALPEVLGDAALLVDPFDEAALADALDAAAHDAAVRATLRARGLARAARYDWARAAEETWAVYRSAVGAESA